MGLSQTRSRLPGSVNNFQGPQGAHRVMGMNVFGSHGIQLLQPGVADLRGPALQLGAQRGLGGNRWDLQACRDRLDVEAGAPYQDGGLPLPMGLSNARLGRPLELGHGVGVAGIHKVDQLVGPERPLGEGRLGGADVELPIYLAGVGVQQGGSQPSGQ